MPAVCFAHAQVFGTEALPLEEALPRCTTPGCEGRGFFAVPLGTATGKESGRQILAYITPWSAIYMPKELGWRPGMKNAKGV